VAKKYFTLHPALLQFLTFPVDKLAAILASPSTGLGVREILLGIEQSTVTVFSSDASGLFK